MLKKYKKFVSIGLSIAISCTLIFPVISDLKYASASTRMGSEKMYCTVTLNDNFDEGKLIVIVDKNPLYSVYSANDFKEVNCTNVKIISTGDSGKDILELTIPSSTKEETFQAMKILEQRPDLVYVGVDLIYSTCSTTPNDYDATTQWGIDGIDLPTAWDIQTGSDTVKVGVIDSGIDVSHTDLMQNVDTELSRNYAYEMTTITDYCGHGTQVAGVIGAVGNNNLGVTGTCWNISMVSLAVADRFGVAYESDAIEAINYAETIGLPIVNFSIAYLGNSTAYSLALDNALQVAISNYSGLFVCAAGNEDLDLDENHVYPADYNLSNLISVGGYYTHSTATYADIKVPSSNYGGQTVHIFAPGQNIRTTNLNNTYIEQTGTSFATPFVTGVAALLLAEYPTMTTDELKATILQNAIPSLYLSGLSMYGKLNAGSALANPIYLD